jgi:hypothetical protein
MRFLFLLSYRKQRSPWDTKATSLRNRKEGTEGGREGGKEGIREGRKERQSGTVSINWPITEGN